MAQFESPLLFAAVLAILSLNPALSQTTLRLSQTSIGFEKASYTFAEEDGFFSVRLIKRPNDASQQRFSIEFHVLPESAQYGVPSDGGDFVYSPSGSVVRMGPSLDTVSIVFFVFDDTKPEYNESILVTSSAAPGSPSSFECSQDDGCFQSTRITIVDNDELVIGFESATMEVSESVGEVELCVNISRPSNAQIEIRPFNLTVESHTGTADLSDFVSRNRSLNDFGNSKRRQCFNVAIFNDTIPENDEVFTATLEKPSNESLQHIRIIPGIVKITVLDNDVNLGFEHGTYNVSEGDGSIEVCVKVKSGSLRKSLHLSLTTVDGDASASADFANTSADLRFGPTSRKPCVLIPVINDMVPEVPEHFRVKLAMATPLPGIVLTPDFATIVINDDDVIMGFERAAYSISEDSGSVEVCVQVKSGILQNPLNLSLTTVDGDATASSDYTNTTAHLRFGPSRTKRCVLIPVINDIVPEVQECFRVIPTVINPSPGVTLTPNNATIVINSDDELVVGFQKTSLEVSESAGKVKLCVNISQPANAPVEIEFNLTVETRAGTADSSDFVELTSANHFLNEFGNHKRRQCFNMTIINDSTGENHETFTVVLAKPSNERHPHIRIHPGTITITITDDDNPLPSCDSFLRILFPDRFLHCDNTCTYTQWSQWQRVPNSDVNVANSVCNSGQAYSQRRLRTASESGCDPKTETRQVCILDREDTLIYSLGLGSTGYDYSTSTPPQTPPSNTTRRRRQTSQYHCAAVNGTDVNICPSLFKGKRAVRKKLLPPYSYHARHPRQTGVNICSHRSILFLLDTSGSIGSASFTTMTTAVSRLVTLFCVPTQFAVMTFSSLLRLEFCFDCFDNTLNGRVAAGEAINNTRYRGGSTYTGEAARCACDELLDISKCGLWGGSCIDVVFITDGKSNGDLDVCREVLCLHNHRQRIINTYAIGIKNYNRTEIGCISGYSTSEEVVFGFESFEEFVRYLDNVITRLLLPKNIGRYNCINRDRSMNP